MEARCRCDITAAGRAILSPMRRRSPSRPRDGEGRFASTPQNKAAGHALRAARLGLGASQAAFAALLGQRLQIPLSPTTLSSWETGPPLGALLGLDRGHRRRPLPRRPAPGGRPLRGRRAIRATIDGAGGPARGGDGGGTAMRSARRAGGAAAGRGGGDGGHPGAGGRRPGPDGRADREGEPASGQPGPEHGVGQRVPLAGADPGRPAVAAAAAPSLRRDRALGAAGGRAGADQARRAPALGGIDPPAPQDASLRAEASRRLLELMVALEPPVAIGGDFNQAPDLWLAGSPVVAPSPVLPTPRAHRRLPGARRHGPGGGPVLPRLGSPAPAGAARGRDRDAPAPTTGRSPMLLLPTPPDRRGRPARPRSRRAGARGADPGAAFGSGIRMRRPSGLLRWRPRPSHAHHRQLNGRAHDDQRQRSRTSPRAEAP